VPVTSSSAAASASPTSNNLSTASPLGDTPLAPRKLFQSELPASTTHVNNHTSQPLAADHDMTSSSPALSVNASANDITKPEESKQATSSSSSLSPSSEQHPNGTHQDESLHTTSLNTFFVRRYTEYVHKTSISETEACERIHKARQSALDIFRYKCIQENRFSEPRISSIPMYAHLVNNNYQATALTKPFQQLRWLDIGCCFGTDLRLVLLDGNNKENLFGIDLNQEFINIGLDVLFQDREALQDRFAVVNVLQPRFAASNQSIAEVIVNGVDIVYCASVYHLLNKEDSEKLSHIVSLILNSNPDKSNRMLIGRTMVSLNHEPIVREDSRGRNVQMRYLHTMQTFQSMLEKEHFTDIQLTVQPTDLSQHANYVDDFHLPGDITGVLSFSARRPFKE
jgi:hypothetical protein